MSLKLTAKNLILLKKLDGGLGAKPPAAGGKGVWSAKQFSGFFNKTKAFLGCKTELPCSRLTVLHSVPECSKGRPTKHM